MQHLDAKRERSVARTNVFNFSMSDGLASFEKNSGSPLPGRNQDFPLRQRI